MSNSKNYTILDIAKMANVSRGTVDRVIHSRGTVSKKSYQKVKKILDKIDYKPNLIAQSLQRKGQLLQIAALIPNPEYDVFWKRPVDGILQVQENFSTLGVNVEIHFFDSRNVQDFQQASNKIFDKKYDGLLMVPFFYNESLHFFKKIELNSNTPYITFNTCIPESKAISHVGQDLILSGRVAGELMKKIVPQKCTLLIIHVNEDLTNSMHMQEKEAGFKQYFENTDTEIKVLKIDPKEDIEQPLLNKIKAEDNLNGIYVTTSKVHLIASIVSKLESDIKLIGYDLIDENIQQLKADNIDFLIFQNPKFQANLGTSFLIDALIFKKDVPATKNLPIEIITKENFKNYLEE